MAQKSLEERIQRLEDVHEIQNLMGRYSYLHTADMQEETVALWAKKTPGVRADIPSFGYYKGYEGIRRLYVGAHPKRDDPGTVGSMHMHTLTTPVIEVAGDGKTAKGVWISPGHESGVMEGKAQAFWAWLKYGADFVKEDGKWKFWHLCVYGIFFTPYDKPWTEQAFPPGSASVTLPDEGKPDKITTYWTTYTPTSQQELIPAPPEPYETWDESTAYVEEF